MTPPTRHTVIQANSPKLLEEEVARFAKAGWHATSEPVLLKPAETGRPNYWVQSLGLTSELAPDDATLHPI